MDAGVTDVNYGSDLVFLLLLEFYAKSVINLLFPECKFLEQKICKNSRSKNGND